MLTQIFTEQHLDRFLYQGVQKDGEAVPYSPAELIQMNTAIEEMYQKITSSIEPAEENPEFILAIGAPGSGKSTFLNNFFEESEKEFALVDMDLVRENLSLYQDALAEKLQKGASPAEADDFAFNKYRFATTYVGRAVANRLFDEGYNIAYPAQPTAFLNNIDVWEGISDSRSELKIKFFDAPYDQLETSIQNRADETGRQTGFGQLELQCTKLYEAIETALSIPIESEFYWRNEHDSDAVLVCETDGIGNFNIMDTFAVHKIMGKTDEVKHLLDSYKHSKSPLHTAELEFQTL